MGVRYEARGHEYFRQLFGRNYISGQWIMFKDLEEPKVRWCQTDGLLLVPEEKRVIVLEFKYQHTSDAWWQLRKLYQPLVEHLFEKLHWTVCVCEVVKWYDPATRFPERVKMVSNVLDVTSSDFGVHIWKP
jgi:hypothetical protein